jgi:hypothetical protein
MLAFLFLLAEGRSGEKKDNMLADIGLVILMFSWEQPVYLQVGPLQWLPLVVVVEAQHCQQQKCTSTLSSHSPLYLPLPRP